MHITNISTLLFLLGKAPVVLRTAHVLTRLDLSATGLFKLPFKLNLIAVSLGRYLLHHVSLDNESCLITPR